MTLKLLLITYVVGGLTFLPLLAIAALLVLFYSSPHSDKQDTEDASISKSKERQENGLDTRAEGAASATFAVLRRYDFQAATAALKDANGVAERQDTGMDGQNGDGVSVYQSMYRTVFDRNRNAVNPLHENEDATTQQARAKSAGRVFYIVLRHGHLMLYDSAIQFEVRHVISLAHYTISLEDDITSNPADFLESDVFTRRTAVVLTPKDAGAGKKPYFLFGDVNIDKEDFYYALLSSSDQPPVPKPLEIESMIKLQSALHSNSLSQECRALDALIGRVFLALHRTPFLEAFVRHKIETKMARIPKPAFIASMACHALDLGDAAPVLSNLKVKDINISGEIVLSLDLKYSGGVNLTVSAAAKLDLGPRFKTRMVSLLLAVVLQRLQGKMLVKIKPPPSNRIWFCFEAMPDMELKIEPVVSSRQITYSFVLRAIEARIREAFAEGLVKPNWDDTPFFSTIEQKWRGGIWESGNAAEADHEAAAGEAAAEVHPLSERNGKTSSTPTLSSTSGADVEDLGPVKRRTTANLLSQAAKTAAEKAHTHLAAEKTAAPAVRVPKSLRSPSFAPPAALVAVDDSSADAVRASDATTPTRRRWIGRNASTQAQKRDAVDEIRQVRDRDSIGRKNSSNEDLHTLGSLAGSSEADLIHDYPTLSDTGGSLPRAATMTDSDDSNDLQGRHLRGASTDSAANPQRKTLLASTAAATAAARQWTWNAVANRQKGQPLWNRNASKQNTQSNEDLPADAASQAHSTARKQALPSGPVGRGQPLPPPGKPLPGPTTKGLWSAAATGIGNMRKRQPPTLPPRRTASGQVSLKEPVAEPLVDDTVARVVDEVIAEPDSTRLNTGEADTEFGPWMTNDINDETNIHDRADEAMPGSLPATVAGTDDDTVAQMPAKKIPPPLPRRPVPSKAADTEGVSTAGLPVAPSESLQSQSDETDLIDLQPHSQDHDESEQLEAVPQHEDARIGHTGSELPVATHLPDSLATNEPRHGAQHTEQDLAGHGMDDLSDHEDMPDLDDDIQAIPAPVDAETEESGVLDLAEDAVDQNQEDGAETDAARLHVVHGDGKDDAIDGGAAPQSH